MAVAGSLESIIDQLVLIQTGISGVTTAFKEPPDALQSADLPAFVNRPQLRQRGDNTPFGSDALIVNQTIEMTLYLREYGMGLTNQSIGVNAWALLDTVEAAFATNPRLADTPATPISNGVIGAFYQGCNGYEIRSYPEGGANQYTALVFTILVTTARVIPPLS